MIITKEDKIVAKNILERLEKEKFYNNLKQFVENSDNKELQEFWNSLTEKERRAQIDEWYDFLVNTK